VWWTRTSSQLSRSHLGPRASAANYGTIATFLAELFGTRVRYSGPSQSDAYEGERDDNERAPTGRAAPGDPLTRNLTGVSKVVPAAGRPGRLLIIWQ
jgi:hypothetical protein